VLTGSNRLPGRVPLARPAPQRKGDYRKCVGFVRKGACREQAWDCAAGRVGQARDRRLWRSSRFNVYPRILYLYLYLYVLTVIIFDITVLQRALHPDLRIRIRVFVNTNSEIVFHYY
jgi:hypothetical protein